MIQDRLKTLKKQTMVEKTSQKYGLPPGALVFVGEEEDQLAMCQVVRFDQNHFEVLQTTDLEEALAYSETELPTWLNLQGMPSAAQMEVLGQRFGIHPLVLEDILDAGHPAKLQPEFNNLFLILKIFSHLGEEVVQENFNLILNKKLLLTIHNSREDYFSLIRERLKIRRNRIQEIGLGYLFFALIDLLLDRQSLLLDWLEEAITDLDEALFEQFEGDLLEEIHSFKKLVLQLHRHLRPLKEISLALIRADSPMLNAKVSPFLHDLVDHADHLTETLNGQREALINLQAQYLALTNQRMNEIMKVLTMMGSIFIPLTFLAGVYGMNFRYMPELQWEYGYFWALGIMATTALSVWAFFKSRRWL
ncbi:MAG: magnesium and cobalt transport protein CorA [Candidatus Lambdaproteobacteria bacterium RIFOXYD2_FULL_50_16]|uniref:Magnesium transport protein CorA n=1 Tax=Candidatus Lambdaproteobacteria bacterium RIFOXYD2_FULL_50_16 TaxID=1817772 RepID=A0A1F6GDM5_9PROT|nr:MAG: magnesium and cobalt transport protein CorA [Candidatus Lambdaproteobacteria bacterium RIFOXYD2_FULL_50_16]